MKKKLFLSKETLSHINQLNLSASHRGSAAVNCCTVQCSRDTVCICLEEAEEVN
jgi:hypothetical protein